MNVNEQTVLMLGILLVGIPVVLSLGSLIYESILNKREQAKHIEHCCHECCGCQGCVDREDREEEECGCCGKPLSECECNCSCHKH